MSVQDRIDPPSKAALDALLAGSPGGLHTNPDIVARRAEISAVFEAFDDTVPDRDRVTQEDLTVPGPAGAPDVPVRVYRPVGATGTLPGIYLIHGGGMVMGDLDGEDRAAILLTTQVGCVTVSVGYRLAPEHPDPAPVEDCYAGLVWMSANAAELGVDPERIAVFGASAGGGLAAGTSLLARDRGGPALCFQALIYPMLDDRNVTPSSHEILDLGVWDRSTNLQAWGWYLGERFGTDDVTPYAAPARATDLSGLPPTFMDVGELDLFRDEDLDLATRLLRAGVPTELHVYPGAYHASEHFAPDAPLSRRIWAARVDALRRALGTAD